MKLKEKLKKARSRVLERKESRMEMLMQMGVYEEDADEINERQELRKKILENKARKSKRIWKELAKI